MTLRMLCGAGLVHGLPDGTEEAQLQEVEAEVERQAAALKQIKAQNRQARRPFCACSQECQDRRSRGARCQGAMTCQLCACAWRCQASTGEQGIEVPTPLPYGCALKHLIARRPTRRGMRKQEEAVAAQLRDQLAAHAPALRELARARTAATQGAKEPEANLLSVQAEAAAGQLLDRVATAHAEYATQRGALAAQLKSLAGEVATADAAAAAAAEARAAAGPGSEGLNEAAVRARMAAAAADARLHEAAIAAQEARPWMRSPSTLFLAVPLM